MMMEEIRAGLKQFWGYDDFRPPQGEIVEALLIGKDALIILPTGAGKSICFQLPALLQDGLTLVISPLLALMENQVQELKNKGFPAALLHSQLSKYEKKANVRAIASGKLKLLYISPETLLSPFLLSILTTSGLKINSLIIDEAHCLVQWGDTFRPSYQRLGTIRPYLAQFQGLDAKMAIAAFTATADPMSQQTIIKSLQLQQPQIFQVNPYRPNLHPQIKIICTPKSRQTQTQKFLSNQAKSSGLIYVRTRRDSEKISLWLQSLGYQNSPYHAGLSAKQRRQIELDWLENRLQFVVCTSAFGMGINKPDVRWVLHYQTPNLLVEYLQEIGRAGRDDQPTQILTLISEPTGWLNPEDKRQTQRLINNLHQQYQQAQKTILKLPIKGDLESIKNEIPQGEITLAMLASIGQLTWLTPFNYQRNQNIKPDNLKAIIFKQKNYYEQMKWFLTTNKCRWQFLLNSFGFTEEAINFRCGQCDNCLIDNSPA
jgi:ATP-dependent DNA helicase RecQ